MKSQLFSLNLPGPIKLDVNAQVVEFGLWVKSQLLLAYLAGENRFMYPREILPRLLWAYKPQGAALTGLYQMISRLHKVIFSLNDCLHITSHTIQVNNLIYIFCTN